MTSLSRRVALTLVGSQLVLLAIGTWVAYRAGTEVMTRQFDETSIQRARTLASLLEQQGRHVGVDLEPAFVPEYFRDEQPEYFQLWVGEHVLGRSPALAESDLPLRAGTLDEPLTWDATLPDGRPGRCAGLTTTVAEVEPDPRTGAEVDAAEVTLVVAKSRAGLDLALGRLLAGLSAGAVVLMLGGLVVVFLAVRHSLRPVHALAARVRELDADTLARPLETAGAPRELQPVVEGLNDLLARLDRALRAERRTASNIAHELRTPISELRSLTEVALQDPGDLEFRARALDQAHEIALQMDGLVDVIRQLTRVDAPDAELPSESIPVRGLVDELLPIVRDRAAQRRVDLDVVVDGEVLDCNRGAAQSVCRNLLANAVEYSTAGSRIEVRSRADGDRVVIRFSNACEGIGPEHLPFVTEPFWRRSTARTNDEHYGLGLTIAHGFARLAGIELRLRVEDGRFVAEASAPGQRAS